MLTDTPDAPVACSRGGRGHQDQDQDQDRRLSYYIGMPIIYHMIGVVS